MTAAVQAAGGAPLAEYLRLLKPRVMSLAVFTAAIGMLRAPIDIHPVVALASMLAIAAGAGAAGALNMWWDADIDGRARRTAGRPTVTGSVSPEAARDLGLGLAALSVMLLSLFANPLAGALLALAIAHYAVVYTMWLKRRSVHAVVIGGLAGALPPAIGWAAATGTLGVEAALMVLVVFLWTPPHSWALALVRREEYADTGVPILPVHSGVTATRCQILLYTVPLLAAGLALAATDAGGPISMAAALAAGGLLMLRTIAAVRPDAGRREEGRLFGASIVYLFALFAAMLADGLLGLGLGGGY